MVLSEVELGTSGTYRCEVITEGPVFHTKFGEGNMTVIGECCEGGESSGGGRIGQRTGVVD